MRASATRRKGLAHSLVAGHHALIADEPESHGGTDTGPRPTELLAMSLAGCTAITLEMYAERKGWDVGDVVVDVDCEIGKGERPMRYDVTIKVREGLSEEQLERLGEIACKCPVYRVLTGDVEINETVETLPA
jgi:putative redox protein